MAIRYRNQHASLRGNRANGFAEPLRYKSSSLRFCNEKPGKRSNDPRAFSVRVNHSRRMVGDDALCSSGALIKTEYLAKFVGNFAMQRRRRERGFKIHSAPHSSL